MRLTILLFLICQAGSAQEVKMLRAPVHRTLACEHDYLGIEQYVSKQGEWSKLYKVICEIIEASFLRKTPLSEMEKKEICHRPQNALAIREAATRAQQLEKLYFGQVVPDSEGNAYRHCLFAALMALRMSRQEVSDFLNAREFGKQIASRFNETIESLAASREMDVHNNNMGFEVGNFLKEENIFSPAEADRRCLEKLNSGELKVLNAHFKLPISFVEGHSKNF